MKCCDIVPGMLRTPFAIHRQVRTSIGGGATNLARAATAYASGRCFFKSLSGTERLYAERVDATSKHRIVIRFVTGVTESDTVIIDGRAYNVRFIDNIEKRNRWLAIDLDGGVPL